MASLLVAALAAWVANHWVSGRSPAADEVVSAAIEIPLGTKIEQRHLKITAMGPGQAPRGAFHSFTDVLGKISTSEIIAGEIVLSGRLAESGVGSALASVVAQHMRAVTVRVDDVVGVAGFLLPGNRVDVIATEKDNSGNKVSAETILSNVKVLAVDQSASSDTNQPVVVRAVTLEVSPADAETLLKGKTAGSIQLALRNPLDQSDARTKTAPTAAVIVPAAIKRVIIHVPAGPPKNSGGGVTVIRGTAVGRAAADQPVPQGQD